MKMFFGVVALVSVLAAAGCSAIDSTMIRDTQGATGCPADSITIVDKDLGIMSQSWTAKCGDKTYYCLAGAPSTCKEAQKMAK